MVTGHLWRLRSCWVVFEHHTVRGEGLRRLNYGRRWVGYPETPLKDINDIKDGNDKLHDYKSLGVKGEKS